MGAKDGLLNLMLVTGSDHIDVCSPRLQCQISRCSFLRIYDQDERPMPTLAEMVSDAWEHLVEDHPELVGP